MSQLPERSTGDLIRWLKMLALPGFAKMILAGVMLLALLNALFLLLFGMWDRDKDAITSGVSILTVAIPVGLLVLGLVFNDGGTRKLRLLTKNVLEKELPQAIRENFNHSDGILTDLTLRCTDFICDYTLHLKNKNQEIQTFDIRIELNVKKVNVIFWIPGFSSHQDRLSSNDLKDHFKYKNCLIGAHQEGYILNENPILSPDQKTTGFVFIKLLHEDFLLEPAHRLYFEQDLSFFIRGMSEGLLSDA